MFVAVGLSRASPLLETRRVGCVDAEGRVYSVGERQHGANMCRCTARGTFLCTRPVAALGEDWKPHPRALFNNW